MDASRRRLLGIYLNDHLAGSTVGVERARMTRDANQGTEFAAPLGVVCGEIEEDRESLESLMDGLGMTRSRIKPAIGWLGERLGRAKPNGQLRGYSPLSRVVDLEMLLLGVSGKLRLWTLLADLLDGESPTDLDRLSRRAEGQRATIEELELRAARLL